MLIKLFFRRKRLLLHLILLDEMRDYLQNHCENGGSPHQVTRHMMGLFHGLPGAKAWRQLLSNAPSSNNLDFFDEGLGGC